MFPHINLSINHCIAKWKNIFNNFQFLSFCRRSLERHKLILSLYNAKFSSISTLGISNYRSLIALLGAKISITIYYYKTIIDSLYFKSLDSQPATTNTSSAHLQGIHISSQLHYSLFSSCFGQCNQNLLSDKKFVGVFAGSWYWNELFMKSSAINLHAKRRQIDMNK